MLGSPLPPHKSLGSPSYNSQSRTRRTTSTMRFHFSIYCCNGSENTKDILWSSKFRGYKKDRDSRTGLATETLAF